MKNPLRSSQDYESFLYSLADQFPSIQNSTLALVRRGASLARVSSELLFAHGFRVVVRERVLFDRWPGIIDCCGYEVWHGAEKRRWYDCQPHPDDPGLQSTHPHHKHVPPDIKHNRIPAPGMSFAQPNLPVLIQEIEALLNQTSSGPTSY